MVFIFPRIVTSPFSTLKAWGPLYLEFCFLSPCLKLSLLRTPLTLTKNIFRQLILKAFNCSLFSGQSWHPTKFNGKLWEIGLSAKVSWSENSKKRSSSTFGSFESSFMKKLIKQWSLISKFFVENYTPQAWNKMYLFAFDKFLYAPMLTKMMSEPLSSLCTVFTTKINPARLKFS